VPLVRPAPEMESIFFGKQKGGRGAVGFGDDPQFIARRSAVTAEKTEAQWGGLEANKTSGRRRGVFSLTPFIELIRTYADRLG
jgi:inosine/xanthosine triphosphate pyrophosphatase family protein